MKINYDTNSLNKIAENYHLNKEVLDKGFDRHFHQLCFEWMKSYLNPKFKILEMGYGEGNVTKNLLSLGMKVDILEGSKLLSESARQEYGQSINVINSLFEDFTPDCQYDVIIATNILEHVDNPINVLNCIHKWCNSNTIVIVTVPNAESIHRRLAVLMNIQPSIYTLSPRDLIVGHQRVYDFSRLESEINESGFKIINKKGFLLKVLPNSLLMNFDQDLINAFYSISDQIDFKFLADIGIIIKKQG